MEILQNEIQPKNGNPEAKIDYDRSVLRDILVSLTDLSTAVDEIKKPEEKASPSHVKIQFPDKGIDFHAAKKEFEIQLVTRALEATNGHQVKAAELLNICPTTLNSIIKRHKIAYIKKIG